jgi:CheY-like chemotaxis protein
VVLVVEDEEEARTFLTQILELEGFSALGFPNGAEALDYLHTADRPCLIILDLRMPVMDGSQFRAAQRQDPRLASIPVVVVTALDPTAAAGLSPLRVLRKPVDIETLLQIVRDNC